MWILRLSIFILLLLVPPTVSEASFVDATTVGAEDPSKLITETVFEGVSSSTEINHGQRQIDWVRANGGFVSDKYEIRREDPNDVTSRLAVFAKEDISKNELLLSIPRSCIVETFQGDICDTVQLLVQEMKLGNESHFEPYVTYLKSQAVGQLPTMWTDSGKELLNQMIGARKRSGLSFLPPKDAVSVQWGCYDPRASLLEQQAAMLITQRGWDEVMIPVFDMISHRNGDYFHNTKEVHSVHLKSKPVQVVADRDIQKGEELYTSYARCWDCGGRKTGYGTPEILRDYGFVEMYPQRWDFVKQGIAFTLDYHYDENSGEPFLPSLSDGGDDVPLQLIWHAKPPIVKLEFFRQQMARLQEYKENQLSLDAQPEHIPQQEWETIQDFHAALTNAIQILIENVHEGDGEEIVESYGHDYNNGDMDTFSEEEMETSGDNEFDHGERQVNWVRRNGGYVSDKIEIRQVENAGNTYSYGVFAVEDIEETEMLLSIPRQCVLQTFNDNKCDTVDLLVEEMHKGPHSLWEPYVSYLKSQPYGQLPSLWSAAAQEVLSYIHWEEDPEDSEWYQVLPPESMEDWRRIGCRYLDASSKTPPVDKLAAMLVSQRGWDEVMIPVYDMMSHRNGEQHLNTREIHSVHDISLPVQVEASRQIKAGEEIYTSYDSCFDCGARKQGYGTPEIFRDYGFVELYPQRFTFGPTKKNTVSFTLDIRHAEDGGDEELFITWENGKSPDEVVVKFMETQVERLQYLGSEMFAPGSAPPPEVSEHEWEAILSFHEAMVTALEIALLTVSHEENCLNDSLNGGKECPLSESRYNPLDEMFDDEDYNRYVCDIDWNFPGYETLEVIQSQYQKIHFIQDPNNLDVCFSLDHTWQQCGSYRPHYHEMVTHYGARFLPEIKRVLWVGGGDSLLLHEIIKYPSLELAIGLELDQQVTRYAFKHFGSQPHFDNDKVQWWYGDAAKSFLMMPREYFGTFDLVLVDLSETVMSHLVTDGLDIMAAMTLLLSPTGIFVKNEIYLEKLNQIFKNTIQLHYYDVPVLCSQALIFGSNSVDFLNVELTDHGIDNQNLFMTALKDYKYRHHEIHDFVHNPYPQQYCKNESISFNDEYSSKSQERSPGLLMILEAEYADPSILNPEKLESALVSCIKSQGLSLVTTMELTNMDGLPTIIAMMKEGYFVARAWPKQSYVAYDIHLWSSYSKIQDIKTSLLKAIGSQNSSVYRIVAPGMFNVATWREDEKSRGPAFDSCEGSDSAPIRETPIAESIIDVILEESVALLTEDKVVAAIACGTSKESCKNSIDVLKRHRSVKDIVVLACPSIHNVEYAEDSAQRKFACESEVLLSLRSAGQEIGLLLFDANAPFSMGQVVHKIASNVKSRMELFSDKLLVLAPMIKEDDSWRRIFLDKFREIFQEDPAFRSQVLFNTTDSTVEMGSFSSLDYYFIERLLNVTDQIEGRLVSQGVVADLRNVEGAVFPRVEDPNPNVFALPGDYENREPYEQWMSQQPTGNQTVVQFEGEEEEGFTSNLLKDLIDRTLLTLGIRTSEPVKEFKDLGDGSVVVALWEGGNVVVLWDGRTLVGVNLFTYDADPIFTNRFLDTFQENSSLSITLRDEMPRGYGRVVNFAKDLNDMTDSGEIRNIPHWAVDVVKQ